MQRKGRMKGYTTAGVVSFVRPFLRFNLNYGFGGEEMITVNGEKQAYKKVTVLEFLKAAGYRLETVAVEINEEIVPKRTYETTYLCDEDKIEIIHFVGGG